jgi:two-component system KDP operon response regulator KdpE
LLSTQAEPQIQRLLGSIFKAAGYETYFATDGAAAIPAQTVFCPDVAVLDLDLPGSSRHNTIVEIRRCSDVPVIALSRWPKEGDLVAALDLGADDYIAIPFRSSELLARIRSALRRGVKAKGENALYQRGALLIDIIGRSVMRDGVPIKLEPAELAILSLLVRGSGRVVPHRQFLELLSAEGYSATKASLRTRIWGVRQKIEDDPNNPKILLTEDRIGYRLARG